MIGSLVAALPFKLERLLVANLQLFQWHYGQRFTAAAEDNPRPFPLTGLVATMMDKGRDLVTGLLQ